LPALKFRNFELIEQWMADATKAQRVAMRRWIRALPTGPTELAHHSFKRADGRGFTQYLALVPGTGAGVTFMYHEYPVRLVTFVKVLPAP
jgi:hypothetical protein